MTGPARANGDSEPVGSRRRGVKNASRDLPVVEPLGAVLAKVWRLRLSDVASGTVDIPNVGNEPETGSVCLRRGKSPTYGVRPTWRVCLDDRAEGFVTRRHRKRLDDVDHQLIDLLCVDPRVSNRALANRIGVTDETVAARLRSLRDDDIVATTAVVDWERAGYGAAAIARITTSGRPAAELEEPMRELDGVHFVGLASGCCDLVVALLGRDLPAVRRNLGEVGLLKDVVVVAADLVVDSLKFDTSIFTLPLQPWEPADLRDPELELDELDLALVGELVLGAHESNRELGRRLNVSGGTVRARIRRLEECGLMRIVAGRDPVATGEMQAHAMAFVTVDGTAPTAELFEHPLVLAAHQTVGRSDIILSLGAPTDAQLSTFITQDLRSAPGVHGVAVAHLVEVLHHQTHLVRLTQERYGQGS